MSEFDSQRALADLFHDQVVVMQAAWIEWRHGGGAETAMRWVENTLDGPGLIPDSNEPYADDAQRYYSLNKSNPWPACAVCEKPSHTLAEGHGFCSDAHLREWKAAQADA